MQIMLYATVGFEGDIKKKIQWQTTKMMTFKFQIPIENQDQCKISIINDRTATCWKMTEHRLHDLCACHFQIVNYCCKHCIHY